MGKSENKQYVQKGSSAQVHVKYHILWKNICLPDGFGRAVTWTHCHLTMVLSVWVWSLGFGMLCFILQDLLLWYLHLLARPRPCPQMRFDALRHCYKGIASPAFHPSCLTFQDSYSSDAPCELLYQLPWYDTTAQPVSFLYTGCQRTLSCLLCHHPFKSRSPAEPLRATPVYFGLYW